ncbi:MAG: hypothetical protein QM537_02175 [Candidatus Symbiobacter sp.]|nr:hypothetical protein [Candidatus Symbiobacter sp.]
MTVASPVRQNTLPIPLTSGQEKPGQEKPKKEKSFADEPIYVDHFSDEEPVGGFVTVRFGKTKPSESLAESLADPMTDQAKAELEKDEARLVPVVIHLLPEDLAVLNQLATEIDRSPEICARDAVLTMIEDYQDTLSVRQYDKDKEAGKVETISLEEYMQKNGITPEYLANLDD